MELRSTALQSFLVIISMGEPIALMLRRKKLTDACRIRIKDDLLEHLPNEELPRGILNTAAAEFSVTRQTYSRLWKGWRTAGATSFNGELDVTSGKKGSGGTGHLFK